MANIFRGGSNHQPDTLCCKTTRFHWFAIVVLLLHCQRFVLQVSTETIGVSRPFAGGRKISRPLMSGSNIFKKQLGGACGHQGTGGIYPQLQFTTKDDPRKYVHSPLVTISDYIILYPFMLTTSSVWWVYSVTCLDHL